MREILFRGKRVDNGEWEYGSLVIQNGEHISKTEVASDEYYIFGKRGEHCLINPSTVGQYTGLTDKNGKKIFDGNIIQSLETKETAVVQWFPEHSAFIVWCKSSNELGFLYECTKSNIEVIGNIHDNPELLEE